MKARLQDLYKTQIAPAIKAELEIKNPMAVPRITKVVVNTGVKESVTDSKIINSIKDAVQKITGQAAIKTVAKKSIAGFKLREGLEIGVKITLRGKNMYLFLDKLINFALPRVRDFHGVGTKFDGSGNYNLGIKDWLIFPEIDYDVVDKVRGLNITIETSTSNDKEAFALLKAFNMPFKSQSKGK